MNGQVLNGMNKNKNLDPFDLSGCGLNIDLVEKKGCTKEGLINMSNTR